MVRPGYARNYLVPYEIAVHVTGPIRARLEHHKAQAEKRFLRERSAVRSLALRLENERLFFYRRVRAERTVFAPVREKDIRKRLSALIPNADLRSVGIRVPGGKLDQIGTSSVVVAMTGQVEAILEVWLLPMGNRDESARPEGVPMSSLAKLELPLGVSVPKLSTEYKVIAELHRGTGPFSEAELPQTFDVALSGDGFSCEERFVRVTCPPGSDVCGAKFSITPTQIGPVELTLDYFLKNQIISQRQLTLPVVDS